MKKKFFIIGIFLFAFFAFVGSASAVVRHYLSGHSSVDEREIRWNGGTAYMNQLNASIATWNALRRVNIAPDTVLTFEDLRISDINLPDVLWAGCYTNKIGTDTLEVNRAFLLNYNNSKRQNVFTHELGHSLGLAHSPVGNVMYPVTTIRTALSAQDISDYRFLWGN